MLLFVFPCLTKVAEINKSAKKLFGFLVDEALNVERLTMNECWRMSNPKILNSFLLRKILTKNFQNPQLTPSKLENSEQKNILSEKTLKIAHNPKALNLKTL